MNFTLLPCLVALCGLTLLLPQAPAAPGSLDPTFGTGGKVFTALSTNSCRAKGIAVQPDGRIVLAGSDGSFALARYQPGGGLDSTFGNGGKVITSLGGYSGANALTLKSDGKIVAAGFSSAQFAVVRYLPNGTPDPGFGIGGAVVTPVGNADFFTAVAVQSDGRIVAGGYSERSDGGGYEFALVRYLADGSLDGSFGNGGKVTTYFGPQGSGLTDMALQGDGKILAAGGTSNPTLDFTLVRYRPDGSLDADFGSGGRVTTDFNGYYDSASAMTLQSDGKILLAGNVAATTGPDQFAVVRYLTNGGLDPGFGTGGKTKFALGSRSDRATAIAVRPDGRIFVAGLSLLPTSYFAFGLAGLRADGSLDEGFGTGGKVVSRMGYADAWDVRLALPDNGTILLAGASKETSSDTAALRFVLARFEGAAAPACRTLGATEITAWSATLHGTVQARESAVGGSAAVTFEVSQDGVHFVSIPATTGVVGGEAETAVSVPLSSLVTGTTYYYYVRAVSAGGISTGDHLTFVAAARPPAVTTRAATGIAPGHATLHGLVNARADTGAESAAVFFDFSADGVNYTSVVAAPGSVSGSAETSVSARVSGLRENTLYRFRVRAVSNAGVSVGGELLLFAPAVPLPPPTGHTPLLVTTTADHDDGEVIVDCTLREAIRLANGSPDADTIAFASGLAGSITLQSALGTLTVTEALTIAGPGARVLAVSGAQAVRVLHFTGDGPYFLTGLTIREGRVTGSPAEGAGMRNAGTLRVRDCTFTGHRAVGGAAHGGAVFNTGNLALARCSFSDNSATGGASGAGGMGGGVCNATGATLLVEGCTFSGNTGTGGPGANAGPAHLFPRGGGDGGPGTGGLWNQGTATLNSCTFSGNSGRGGSGGSGSPPMPPLLASGQPGAAGTSTGALRNSGGSCTVCNSLLAGNSGLTTPSAHDAGGTFLSGGWNLLGTADNSTGFSPLTDMKGTNTALLPALTGPLQNNGGPTDTMLLLPGSPALDRGNTFALTTDQRSAARTRDDPASPNAVGGDGTDIGAVEMQPAVSGPAGIASVSFYGPTTRILLKGTAGANYQCQTSETLATFANLGSPRAADSLGFVEFTDPGPLPAQRFYRAVQVP